MDEDKKEQSAEKDLRKLVQKIEKTDPSEKKGLYDEIIGHSYAPREESIEKGKALRDQHPRSHQGEWKVKADRNEAVDLIFNQEKGRIEELLPIRHERMKESPFAFYRASAAVMADDLSSLDRTGITVQTCGDAHLSNFGMFRSPERNLVFDINDFDETLPGPWEWDLKRLLTSVEICGRQQKISKEHRQEAVLNAAGTYRKSMLDFSEKGNLEVWYEHLDMQKLYDENKKALGKDYAEVIHQTIQKAVSKNTDKAVSKLCEDTGSGLRFVSRPPLIVPLREMNAVKREDAVQWIARARVEYRMSLPRERRALLDQYQIVDIARKVVGVGSVGMHDWVMLLEGRENSDYLILQLKEAESSVLEAYAGKSVFLEHGHRVVEGQRAIQTAGDIMLGWSRMIDENGNVGDYYVRQLWDGKGSFDLTNINAEMLTGIAGLSAWVLAHAHAKTGDRHAIAGYLGKNDKFDRAMLQFAESYADQNEADYEVFCRRMSE